MNKVCDRCGKETNELFHIDIYSVGDNTVQATSVSIMLFNNKMFNRQKEFCIDCINEIEQVIICKIENYLTYEEIDFLLLSEEERVNTYKNYEEIWKSCISKLEKQREMLTMNKMKEVAKLLGVEIGEKFNIVEAPVNQYYLDVDKGLVNANNFICNDRLIKLLNGEEQIEKLPFKPSYDEDYFCISGDEKIEEVQWDDNMLDYYCYNAKNCFRTEEEITQEDIDRTVKQMKGLYEECN